MDFPIDSKGEIGKKKVRVPSMMMDKMKEGVLKEIVRKIIRKKLWSKK